MRSFPLVSALSLGLLVSLATGCDYERKVLAGGPGLADTTAPPDTPDTTVTPDTTASDTMATPDTTAPDSTVPADSAPDTTPDTEQADTALAPDTTPAPDPEWTHPEVIGVDLGKGEDTPLDPLVPPPEVRPRGRARLDIDQIDLAFQTTLGGITWTRRSGNVDVNQFKALSETLGVPDFIDTTVEDLAATPLFSKFLGDAARKACADRIAADLAITTGRILMGDVPLDATLASHPEAIEAQISSLLLRFHGQTLRPADPGFGEWRWLFQSSTQLTGSSTTAWQAMCVALITHPDFYTY